VRCPVFIADVSPEEEMSQMSKTSGNRLAALVWALSLGCGVVRRRCFPYVDAKSEIILRDRR